ncbi:MAG: MBL fold metallo-hydrolase [Chloroflexota bacterium]|nr:MBL fold metallo-hydrolase [Chloroflexota bacterium]
MAEGAPATDKSSRFRLTIVGCAPAYALRPGHAASCYLVESDDVGILLDMGQGAFAALGAYREPSTLRAVVVSHLHPDHMIDLVALRHYLSYGLDRPRSVPLHAPAELRVRIGALMGEEGFLDALPGQDLEPGTFQLGPLRVEARPVAHALNSFGFRVTQAGAPERAPGLVYSGDCGRPEDILALVRRGDTLLCEASWGSSETVAEEAAHLTARQAAEVARDGGAARLILTHILDAHDPDGSAVLARTVFGGPVELATPGLAVDLG